MHIADWFIEFGFTMSLLINALLFIPQIMSLVRTRSADGVSLLTFGGFTIIQAFTMFHGVITKDYLLAGGYLLSILTCGTVTLLIIYYRLKNP